MSLLSVNNLNLSIHGKEILHNINLSLDEGKVLGIVGESGSGKSLTAFSILQLLPKGSESSGDITLDSQNLQNLDEATLCQIRGNDVSMIFQEPMTALNPVQTIGAQICETIRIHTDTSQTDAEEIARTMLERVELPEAEFPLTRYPHNLSGGQRQRVMIAMAIALRPKLLIADEPTTALDVTTQAEILKLLKRLAQEDGLALMLITHDLAVVAEMADDIIVMKDGHIVEQGKAVQILTDHKHPYTKKLIDASSHAPDRAPVHPDKERPVLSVENVSCDYRIPRRHLFAKQEYFRAVHKVSFEIYKGENIGLVGGSGCGKSTLAKTILALQPLAEGAISINGESFLSQSQSPSAAQRQQTQIVFQDPYSSFNPRHKVRRLVAEPFYGSRDKLTDQQINTRVAQSLEDVGLEAQDGEKYIHEFSGGQRQRIAIARALIVRPALIILDEAVSALDVSIRAQILDLLADLSAQYDLSYLFISHDLSVVRSITDRVLVMDKGHVVEMGATEDVFLNPAHNYTKALIKAIPKLELAASDGGVK